MKIGKRVQDKLNNKGFSLVELIVVISIMTVMTGVLSLGISLMFSRDAQSVATKIDDALTETRTMSMTRSGVYTMTLSTTASSSKNNKIIIKVDGSVEKEIPLDKDAKITAVQENGDDSWSMAGGDIVIEFDKGNGSVKDLDSTHSGVYVFTVESKNKTAKVDLVAVTGRHYVE